MFKVLLKPLSVLLALKVLLNEPHRLRETLQRHANLNYVILSEYQISRRDMKNSCVDCRTMFTILPA